MRCRPKFERGRRSWYDVQCQKGGVLVEGENSLRAGIGQKREIRMSSWQALDRQTRATGFALWRESWLTLFRSHHSSHVGFSLSLSLSLSSRLQFTVQFHSPKSFCSDYRFYHSFPLLSFSFFLPAAILLLTSITNNQSPIQSPQSHHRDSRVDGANQVAVLAVCKIR